MPRPIANTLASPAALARFFLTAAVGLFADLWSKNVAVANLSDGRVIEAIHGWLQFEFILNPGAVFGIAPGKTVIFLIVSVAAVIFLTYLFYTSSGRPFYQIILGLLMAGVLGNMYDRVEIGKVRDMIHMLPGWHWPAGVRHVLPFLPDEVFPYIFNVADSLLCTGVGVDADLQFFQFARPDTDRSHFKRGRGLRCHRMKVYLRRAIRLAMNGRGRVEPNPMVGCVIVKNDRIIGEGFHQQYGHPHAEPQALASCIESPEGATAYVTLEPCCHINKQTPPCAPRLIAAKMARVVIGCLDPNPDVNGKGVLDVAGGGNRC